MRIATRLNVLGQQSLLIILMLWAGSTIALAADKQRILASYWDTNPTESISNPEGTLGLKYQERITFEQRVQKWLLKGNIVGQGFLVPGLLLDSKLVGNGTLDLYRSFARQWSLSARMELFQKVYLSELYRHSRGATRVFVRYGSRPKTYVNVGFSGARSDLYFATHYTYFDGHGFAGIQRNFGASLKTVVTLALGQIRFVDLPAQEIHDGVLVPLDGEDQHDIYQRLIFHLEFRNQIIFGLRFSHENVISNSVLGDARILFIKAYASRRLGQRYYVHLVLQGMDKHYRESHVSTSSPYRDPEEIIQNQIHCQIERDLHAGSVFYIQYSYLKNETIFNQWFYVKQLFEAGLKITL